MLDVIENPDKFDKQERARIRARFHVEQQNLLNELNAFCKSEKGAEYSVEMHDIQGPLVRLNNLVRKQMVDSPENIADEFDTHKQKLIAAISTVPVSIDSVIYEAKTPFSAYCRIKELCVTTSKELVYVDRYIDHTIFHRFLEHVPEHVKVTLVTWPRTNHRNKKQYDKFIDISRLYSNERKMNYRLMTEPNFHDRWLLSDDQLFHLGGSVKDAASRTVYTLSKIGSSLANIQQVNNLINNATELFGPRNRTHP